MLTLDENELPKKSFWKSKVVITAMGLVLGGLYWFLQSYNVVNAVDVQTAQTLSPQIDQVIALAREGQWMSAITALVGVLVAYFRYTSRTVLKI